MKNQKVKEVKLIDMLPTELAAEAKKLRGEIARARVEKSLGKEKNTRAIFNRRKRLARVLTLLTNKAIIPS